MTPRARAISVVAIAVVMPLLSGCRPAYVAKLGIEHLRYMSRARPISEEIARTTDPQRRRRLELVLAAREFADANGLPPGGSYLEVADTDGLSAGYVVTAAQRDKLEQYQWSYPVVGKIPYRGYFERESADAFAAKMERGGYDTYVFPAAGYSTLGWFDDPLPSSALRYDDPSLVELVIHELVHQNVYVKGEIAFNETLATAIAKRLTITFFRTRDESVRAEAAERDHTLWISQSDVFDDFAARLTSFYATAAYDARIDLLAERARIYRELEEALRALEKGKNKSEIRQSLVTNNAVFLSLWGYRKRAGLIERYLDSFESMSEAVLDLREWAKRTEADPYASLQAHLVSRTDGDTARSGGDRETGARTLSRSAKVLAWSRPGPSRVLRRGARVLRAGTFECCSRGLDVFSVVPVRARPPAATANIGARLKGE